VTILLAVLALITGTPRHADHLIVPEGGWRIVETTTGGIAGLDEQKEINSLGERLEYSRGVRNPCETRASARDLAALKEAVRNARKPRAVSDAEIADATKHVSDVMVSTVVIERSRGGKIEALRFAGATAMTGTIGEVQAIRDLLRAMPRCDAASR
jgi:hypothetical protein